MKKNNISLLIAGLFLLTACSDDNDSNPTYKQPESFVLNTPVLAPNVYDLENSEALTLTCTQPDYGFTAATTYSVQVSLDDVWNDAGEETDATYEELDTSYTKAEIKANPEEIDKAIVGLSGWKSEDDMPEGEMDVYIRLRASINADLPPVYSNSIKLSVLPYYIELTDAYPSFFFLIGNYVGGWNAEVKDIGSSMIPMSLVKDYEYDKKTGAGKFTYTGYFEAATSDNGFKLIGMIDGAINWKEQWGNGEDGNLPGNTNLQHLHNEDGNPGHLGVSESGWYKIDVDDKEEQKLTFTKLDAAPGATYTSIEILGEFSEWEANPVEMTLIGSTTHSWTATVTFEQAGKIKFRANADWGVNWGGGTFPFSIAEMNGDDIVVQPGTYIVTFNDIEGSYAFFIQE